LAAAPKQALPLLKGRVRPVVRDEAAMARMIADLDNPEFKVREKATTQLEELGEIAEPALRKALQGKPSLESRKRLEALLEKLPDPPLSDERLRGLRAITVLRCLGTPDARQMLEALARGAEGVRETDAAKFALESLAGSPRATD